MGNHLLQHPHLSAMAIGVAAYIQSLPDGVPVGIKALACRFPEGEVRIASALRELEQHGYLERRRERLEGGRVVTRTYSHNRPGAVGPDGPPSPEPAPSPLPVREPVREAVPEPVPEPVPEEASPPAAEPPATPSAEPIPHPGAVGLLAGLRRYDPRLLLSERDVQRLAPRAAAWLERGLDPDAVARALVANLPDLMHHPAAVLAYRLTALLPPILPPAPPAPAATAVRADRRPDPFQTCDGCERAFRAPHPGRCRSCPAEAPAA
ncbi:helix-turn-helix domain-containing protein [Streptomyces sp. NPDC016562]|uniref:helix-turn-helix domain-containing protein n=1 Tax=Streptomyces sp. NPDC016562 TaxID=3364966 RepID=UPI0036FECBB7